MIPNTTVTAIRTFSLGERALSSVEKRIVLQTDVNSSQQVKLLNNGRNRDEHYFQGCPLFNGRNIWTDRQGVNSLSIVNRDVVHFSKCPLLEVPLKYIHCCYVVRRKCIPTVPVLSLPVIQAELSSVNLSPSSHVSHLLESSVAQILHPETVAHPEKKREKEVSSV